jgi:hypothetical protein
LQGIDATLRASDERMHQRRADREATRLEKATDIKDFSRSMAKTIKAPATAFGKVALPILGKAIDALANAVDSLLAPTLTPQQIHDAEKAKDRREAEAENTIDFSRVTAEAAPERQRDEGRGRER